MLLEQVNRGRHTIVVWKANNEFEFRAFLEGELIKTMTMPFGKTELENRRMIDLGKRSLAEWLKQH